jgi:hypothetical protein
MCLVTFWGGVGGCVLTKNGSRLTSIESPWVPHMRAAVGGAAHVRHSQKLADCDPNVPDPAEASPLSPPNGAVVPDPTGNIASVVECVLCPQQKIRKKLCWCPVACVWPKTHLLQREQRSQGAGEGAGGWRCPHGWGTLGSRVLYLRATGRCSSKVRAAELVQAYVWLSPEVSGPCKFPDV